MAWFKANSTTGHILGVDVSYGQTASSIDWDKARDSGVGFAYIRASSGKTVLDTEAVAHALNVKNAGLPFGFYHFIYPYSSTTGTFDGLDDADSEAQRFIDAIASIGQGYGDLMPVIDMEYPDTVVSAVSKWQLYDWVKRFIEYFEEKSGQQLMIYTGKWFYDMWGFNSTDMSFLTLRKIWDSQYVESNAYLQSGAEKDTPRAYGGWTELSCWQYTSHGHAIDWQGSVNIDGFPYSPDIDRDWTPSIATIASRPRFKDRFATHRTIVPERVPATSDRALLKAR